MKFSGWVGMVMIVLLGTATAWSEDGPLKSVPLTPEAAEKVVKIRLKEGSFTSSIDQTKQAFRYWKPSVETDEPLPVLIFLHAWSADYRQIKADWTGAAVQRGWIFIQPNFRGANNSPIACGSPQAQQDVLDCIDWATQNLNVDRSRIYLAGASGGGHLAMLLTARHPERFSAVSAWVGISDLADWYRFQSRRGTESPYALSLKAVCGGIPGESAEVDEQYRVRSPIHWVHGVGDVPLELAAGVHDGKKGSVPIEQTIQFYNAIAAARGVATVAPEEVEQMKSRGKLVLPTEQDQVVDPNFERDIILRRHAGTARLTIFEGGHEGLAQSACQWLSQHRREVSGKSQDLTLTPAP